MMILVTYDVSTLTLEGRRRLRNVAKICLNYGQRVQYSVFECQINKMEMVAFRGKLLKVIEPEEDSIRIYRIVEPLEKNREEIGKITAIDFENTLIL